MESEKKLRSTSVIDFYRFIEFTSKNLHRNYFKTHVTKIIADRFVELVKYAINSQSNPVSQF